MIGSADARLTPAPRAVTTTARPIAAMPRSLRIMRGSSWNGCWFKTESRGRSSVGVRERGAPSMRPSSLRLGVGLVGAEERGADDERCERDECEVAGALIRD